jgi:hypothetical protein
LVVEAKEIGENFLVASEAFHVTRVIGGGGRNGDGDGEILHFSSWLLSGFK